MPIRNHYDILGIKQEASLEEIKRAYRKLSMKFHPDKNDGDEFLQEMFKKINEANEILSDPKRRAEYDRTLEIYDNSHTEFGDKPNQPKTSSDGNHANSMTIMNLIKLKYNNERILADKKLAVYEANQLPPSKVLSFSKVLYTGLIIAVIHFSFKPKPAFYKWYQEQQENIGNYEWATIGNAEVHAHPNISSEIIGEVPEKTGLKGLMETKYFVRVPYYDSAHSIKEGYIIKDMLKRNK